MYVYRAYPRAVNFPSPMAQPTRWHGYRSDARYIVFQCLQHTLGLERAKWRVLDKCHNARNLAEYEGHIDIDQQLLAELISIAEELQIAVQQLAPIPD